MARFRKVGNGVGQGTSRQKSRQKSRHNELNQVPYYSHMLPSIRRLPQSTMEVLTIRPVVHRKFQRRDSDTATRSQEEQS